MVPHARCLWRQCDLLGGRQSTGRWSEGPPSVAGRQVVVGPLSFAGIDSKSPGCPLCLRRRTYSTLISAGGKAVKGGRLQQVIDWAGGPNFDGVIVFDECHKVHLSDLVECRHLHWSSIAHVCFTEGFLRCRWPVDRISRTESLVVAPQAKNFTPGAEAQSTKVSATVMALQQQLPRARIVYCSCVSGRSLRWSPSIATHSYWPGFCIQLKRMLIAACRS